LRRANLVIERSSTIVLILAVGQTLAAGLGWASLAPDIACLAQLPQKIRELGDIRRDQTRLSVSRVSFLIFVRDCLRRSRPRVQIAKAAITGEYVTQMVARLECAVLAVPVHGSLSDINYRAPGGITISSAGRSPKRHRGGEHSNAKCQFRKGFFHDGASLVSCGS
jgi:hypothetical protein